MKNTKKMRYASTIGIVPLMAAIIFTGAALLFTGCPTEGSTKSDTTVNLLEIQGITPPVEDAMPVDKITETKQYTGTVKWVGGLAANGTFKAGTVYTAIITMKPKSGYTFKGVEANTFTVDGSKEVYHEKNLTVVTVEFPSTGDKTKPAMITIAAIGGVTAPVATQTPATTINGTSSQYTGTIRWSGNPTTFDYSTSYTAIITLTPNSSFTLEGLPDNFFTVSTGGTVRYSGGSNTVTVDFAATGASPGTQETPISGAIGGVNPPVVGKRAEPLNNGNIPGHLGFTGVVTWSPLPVNNLFSLGNQVYTATITLTKRAGFTFNGLAADSLTVAGADTVTHAAGTAAATTLVVTATFPATDAEPDPRISFSASSYEIESEEKGYSIVPTAEIVVKNIGNVAIGTLDIVLDAAGSSFFELSTDTIDGLEVGDQVGKTFEVQAKPDLTEGVYECTVTVSRNTPYAVSIVAAVKFEVVSTKFTITNVTNGFKVVSGGQDLLPPPVPQIKLVIEAIKDAIGSEEAIIVYFGDAGNPLNLGNSTMQFAGPDWALVKLQGSITASFPDNANGTVDIAEDFALKSSITSDYVLESSANIATTAKSEQSSAFFNKSADEVRITGGYIRAEDGTAVRHLGTGDLIIGGDALIEAKTNRGIDNLGSGNVEINNATVTSTTGRAVNNNSDGIIIIKDGSEIEAGTGTAVYNSVTGQIVIEGGKITSRNTTTSLATVVLMGPTSDNYEDTNPTLLTMTGGIIRNTADGGKAVYNNTHDGVEISGDAKIEAFGTGSTAVYNAANGKLEIIGDALVDVGPGIAVYNAANSKNVLIAGDARVRATTGIAVMSKIDDTVKFTEKGSMITVDGNAVVSSSNKNKLQGTIYLTNGSKSDVITDPDIEQLCINGGWVVNNIDGNAIYNEKEGIVNIGYYHDDPGVDANVGDGTVSAVSGIAINNARDGLVRILSGSVYATTGGKAVLLNTGKTGGFLYISGGDVWTENGGITIDSLSDAADYNWDSVSYPAVYIEGASVYTGTLDGTGTSTGRTVWIHNAAKDHAAQGKLTIGKGSRIWSNNPIPADGTIYLESTGDVLINGGEVYNPVELGNAIFNISKDNTITVTNVYDSADPTLTKVWATSGVALFKHSGDGEVFINGVSEVSAKSGKAVYNMGKGNVTIGETGSFVDTDPVTEVKVEDYGIAVHNHRNDDNNTGTVLITEHSKVSATGENGIAVTSSSKAVITVAKDALVTAENITYFSGLALGTIVIEDDNMPTVNQGDERLSITVEAGKVENTGGGVAIYNNSFGRITVDATFDGAGAGDEEHVVSNNGKIDQGTIVLARISKPYAAQSSIKAQLEIKGGRIVNNTNFGNAIYNDSRGHVITSGDNEREIIATGVRGIAINNVYTGDVKIADTSGKTTVQVINEDGTAIRNASSGNVTIGTGTDNLVQSNDQGGIAIDNIGKGNVTITGNVKATGAGGLGVQNWSVGDVTIGAKGKVEVGTGSGILNNNLGKVTVNGADAAVSSAGGSAIQNLKDGSVTISSGKVEATGDNGIAIVNAADGKVAVTGTDAVTISSENINSSQGSIFFKEGPGTSGAVLTVDFTAGVIKNDSLTGNSIFNGADSEVFIKPKAPSLIKKPQKGFAVYNKSSTAIVLIDLQGLDPGDKDSVNGEWEPAP